MQFYFLYLTASQHNLCLPLVSQLISELKDQDLCASVCICFCAALTKLALDLHVKDNMCVYFAVKILTSGSEFSTLLIMDIVTSNARDWRSNAMLR